MVEERNSCEDCSAESCGAKTRNDGESEQDFKDRQALARRLCMIDHKILVLSGKGGVGKSTVASGLAVALGERGRRVGLLDVDIHGPSVPRLLGLNDTQVTGSQDSINPAVTGSGVRVMSVGFLLTGPDDAVIWRGPLKYSLIKQFLKDVEWGRLDYLIVDSPPGTGDEPLAVAQLVDDADGSVIVTTPQMLSVSDVRRSIAFSRKVKLPVLGVVENMSGFACPHCGKESDIFGSGGGRTMAEDVGAPFLGSVPIDPAMVSAGDDGGLESYLTGETAGAASFAALVDRLVELVEVGEK
ncbi:MAG: P-loop NTPase [Candidatus Eisenbacteria bacterium]|nr:P-loop NTPase [Candidatus Eisenbacteria bacterium]